MDITALFQLSYGIYIITAHDGQKQGGCLVNTVFQITAEPVGLAVSVSKHNQTHEFILKSKSVAVNIVGEDADTGLLGRFGYRTGYEFEKFSGIAFSADENGDALLNEPGIIAQVSCRVTKQIDMDTHTIFICEATNACNTRPGVPMTYNYFRDVKKLKASKYAPTYHGAN